MSDDKIIHVNFGAPPAEEPEDLEEGVDTASAEAEEAPAPEPDDEALPDNVVQGPWGSGARPAHPLLEVFESFLEHGIVTLSFDSRRDDVQVPKEFKGRPQLALNFSLRFGIDDFAYDLDGVRATLSFGGQGFFCDIAWDAVYVMRSKPLGQTRVFEENVPVDLIR